MVSYQEISEIASTFKFQNYHTPKEALAVLSRSVSEGPFKGATVLWMKTF